MIQIDMKMPEHCVDCPFSLDNCCLVLGRYIPLKQWEKGGIQEWCPLKEQDAVEPRWFVDAHNPAGAFQCSACRERIIEKNIDFYCPNCGKPILWEGR